MKITRKQYEAALKIVLAYEEGQVLKVIQGKVNVTFQFMWATEGFFNCTNPQSRLSSKQIKARNLDQACERFIQTKTDSLDKIVPEVTIVETDEDIDISGREDLKQWMLTQKEFTQWKIVNFSPNRKRN